MLCLQLSAIFVVLTFSDGAVLRNPKCAYQKKGPKFCALVISAYKQNEETQHHMSVHKFSDAMSRLATADQAIDKLLKTEEKEALLQPLHQALDSESSALFKVISKCKNDVTEQPCRIIFRGVFSATIELVEATMEVTDGDKKKKIEELYQAFNKEENKDEKLYHLANGVLEALQ